MTSCPLWGERNAGAERDCEAAARNRAAATSLGRPEGRRGEKHCIRGEGYSAGVCYNRKEGIGPVRLQAEGDISQGEGENKSVIFSKKRGGKKGSEKEKEEHARAVASPGNPLPEKGQLPDTKGKESHRLVQRVSHRKKRHRGGVSNSATRKGRP